MQMVIINNRLTDKQKLFFDRLSVYIDQPIYFYGSILRSDYIKGKSDIDIDIFTDNESSTIQKISNLLEINKSKFRKIVSNIHDKVVYGYKANYEDEINDIKVEISIYNNKYKHIVLNEHNNGRLMPFYMVFLLYILKFLYYQLGIIPINIYKSIKNTIMHPTDNNMFVITDRLHGKSY